MSQVNVGDTFGRWNVVSLSDDPKLVNCRCACGVWRPVIIASLTRGKSTNCGCARREGLQMRNHKHGHSGRGQETPTYESWRHMKQRCENPKCKDYPLYGGRGISVCEDWLDYSKFLQDMGEAPDGLTLDRINPDLGYCKENCRWATRKEQTNNRREFKQEGRKGELSSTSKLTKSQVEQIKSMTGISQREIAVLFGVSQSNVSMIRSGKTWSA